MDIEIDDKSGDTQLTANNVSATRLLNRADWSGFFASKGYTESFPMVIYAHDQADELYTDLITEAGLAQSPDRQPRLRIGAFTRFADLENDTTEGAAWLIVEGLDGVQEELRQDLITLLLSGTADWLRESYTMDEIAPQIDWVETLPEILETLDPTEGGTHALVFRATIRQQ